MGANARRVIIAALGIMVLAAGCAVQAIESPVKIGLLAPFEGRYREIGYEALYAARLAITESGRDDITLLAVDDGGTASSAKSRAHALADDPSVKAVIVLGYDAADAADAFGDIPVIVVENWFIRPGDSTFILGSPELNVLITVRPRIEVTEAVNVGSSAIGGIIFSLEGFRKIRQDLTDIQLISSSTLPDAAFRERYINSDLFTPEPGLLATLSYDATQIAIASITSVDTSRPEVAENIRMRQFEGINGLIAFQNGYWREAPLHTYKYLTTGELALTDNIIK